MAKGEKLDSARKRVQGPLPVPDDSMVTLVPGQKIKIGRSEFRGKASKVKVFKAAEEEKFPGLRVQTFRRVRSVEGELIAEASPERVAFASALKKARSNAGLTQTELSRLSGINQSVLSKWERAVGEPSFSSLHILARVLNVPAAKLLG